jgi:hypothetical protein
MHIFPNNEGRTAIRLDYRSTNFFVETKQMIIESSVNRVGDL